VKKVRLLTVYLAVVLIGIGMPLLMTPARSYWDSPPPTISSESQGTAYLFEIAYLNYTVTAPRFFGLSSVSITSFTVQPEWQTSARELLPHSYSVRLSPGDSQTFTESGIVPGDVTIGTHNVTVICEWQEFFTNGTFSMPSTTVTYIDQINIASRPALQLNATGTPIDSEIGFTVQFNSQVSGGTPGYSYLWKFGDGSTDTSANPIHAFPANDSYDVNLTLYDALNRIVETNFSITVYPPLQINASCNVTSGVAPLTVQFSCNASGGLLAYSYLWTFGDGNTSNEANVSHQYSQMGNYKASLTVTDNQSLHKTYQTSITVGQAQMDGGSGTDDNSDTSNNNNANTNNNGMDNQMVFFSAVLIIGLVAGVALLMIFIKKK